MRWICLFLMLFPASLGCSAEAPKSRAKSAANGQDRQPAESPAMTAAGQSAAQPEAPAKRRKLIYTATVQLIVEDFEPVPSQVETLARQYDGFLARSNLSGSPGQPRHGQWTIRIPVDRYEPFLAAVRELGEVQTLSSDSKDVTEEYQDVESRIRNKKQEEERLLTLLKEATGKLEDILAVEKELSRVRGEVEQAEGRLRVLKDLTDLTTITLYVNEIKNYVPEEGATYATRARRAWDNSLAALVTTAQALSIGGLALVPWLIVLGTPLGLVFLLARRRWRRK